MHTGGWADKLGNRYEGLWTAHQLLLLLNGGVQAVQLENLDQADEGIDVRVWDFDGTCELQQCKKNNSKSNWTLRELARGGVIDALRDHLLKNASHRYAFVSNREPVTLKRLIDMARLFVGKPGEFLAHLASNRSDHGEWLTWCQLLKLPPDAAEGFDLLCRTSVPVFGDDATQRRHVAEFAKVLLDGDPHDILLRLTDFAVEHMGHPIHLDELHKFIHHQTSFRSRDLSFSSAIEPILERCRQEYKSTIGPYLIDGQLIHRPESEAVLQAVTRPSGPRLHFLHGVAGQGKSCVFYELANLLDGQGIPYLPIRLDKRSPKDNTRAFGEALGLPESPVRCLKAVAGKRTAVLIIDQLDALRWTPQHDPSAWLVFAELVNEALQLSSTLHVVVACRTFDLQHDPNISAWRKEREARRLIEDFQLGDLPTEIARKLVEGRGVSWASLTSAQQNLLHKPHHLYLWTRLPAGRLERSVFRSSTDLMRTFWQHVREKLDEMGLHQQEVGEALGTLVNRLDEDGILAAPSGVLENWPRVRRGLLSLTVIEVSDDRVRFTHQSYFDYYLANSWRERLRREKQSIHAWLTAMDEQSLLRRGQLRQLLAVLRDDDPSQFLQAIRDILVSTEVRFHLQHLTLQFLGHLSDPNPQEVKFILDLLTDPAWREPVVNQVLGHPAWFSALDALGFWEEWLCAAESWKTEVACHVLRSASESQGDRVAELLSPYENQSDPWPHRVAGVLPWLPKHDSRKLFDLRLRLVRRGLSPRADLLLSKELLDREPLWLVDLLVVAIERELEQRDSSEQDRSNGWPYWLPHHLEKTLIKCAEVVPAYFCQKLLPLVLRAVQVHPPVHPSRDERPFQGDRLWQEDLYSHEHTGARPLPELVGIAGGYWARTDYSGMAAVFDLFESHPSRTMQQVRGITWLHGPESLAEEAIQWLHDDPRRFSLGYPGKEQAWQLARDLISRYAPLCSAETYAELEKSLLFCYPASEREAFLRSIQSYCGGQFRYRANKYGLLQHALLPALPTDRRSSVVVNAIGQLREKFRRSAEEIEGEDGAKGGFVASPISSHPHRLSDKAWLRLITSVKPGPRHERARWFDDHVLESSPEQFSRDLRRQAEVQPGRFAALALQVPLDVQACYWSSLLDALRLTTPPEGAPDSWEPASQGQCHAVLARVGYQEHRETALSFCRCIDERPDCSWPPHIVATLVRYGMDHPDPTHDGQVLPADSERRLDIEAINTVRGQAAEAIGALLFDSPPLFSAVQPALERLIRDPAACIRVAAIGAILPVLNIDREQAVGWFLQACEDAPDEVLASRTARSFLGYTFQSHTSRLEDVFDRMVKSRSPAVAEDGAAWVALLGLYTDRSGQFEACARGDPAHRRGVAQILSRHLEDQRVAAKCRDWLPHFFDDEDKEIRDLSVAFLHKNLDWADQGNINLLRRYVASQAFLDDPTRLLWEVDEHRGDMRPLAPVLFDACNRMTDPSVIQTLTHTQGWSFDFEKLSQLLLRLYAQAGPSQLDAQVRKGCLDKWDRILRQARLVPSTIIMALDE